MSHTSPGSDGGSQPDPEAGWARSWIVPARATGRVTWLERSVSFSGNNHVATGCRYVGLAAIASGVDRRAYSSPLCVGMEADNTRPFAGTIDLSDVEGGAGYVDITYLEPVTGGDPRVLDTARCTRDGCA